VCWHWMSKKEEKVLQQSSRLQLDEQKGLYML